ncbi:hypothetical protein FFJ24_016315 [Pedobacter sp. KBS0701]|uniref:hypothetical protein n=1 Tax=Pedobacter sp. KBS0701 TaxID=2578106 RepID=UPI00110F4E36|nr:hypothetical protein [Pedobacter sp. KBS0701]QDW26294.1 hypothetical protein FFJ24_016315 [Pedobacter sp. KBS0701]
MKNIPTNISKEDLSVLKKKFDDGVIESVWSENGELMYVIKDGLDLNEYALTAKQILESEGDIAHDFTGKVTNESKTETARFEYKSGWFLDGLVDGEIE